MAKETKEPKEKEEPVKAPEKKEPIPAEKPNVQWKQALATIGKGLVTFLIALKVIIISFLKAITVNFFQNVKQGWGEVTGKPAKPKLKK
ncbi:MAG: hypothetical protein QME12_01245 [Nanoarchaeota archaeon]|nr:hypothetical protein [Nanoarchaeota archaeon]